MNRKGFTLVEMLAVVSILSILSGIAILGVTRYLKSSKDQAYDSIIKSAYSASTNYILDNNVEIKTGESIDVDFDELIGNYMDSPIDPNAKNTQCKGKVTVTKKSSSSSDSVDSIDDYKYVVKLNCEEGSGYTETRSFND